MSTPDMIIKTPVISGKSLICSYIIGNTTYQNSYDFSDSIPVEMGDSRLMYWVALTTSLGMFSIDYFQKINCDFYLDTNEIEFFEKLFYLGLGEFRYVNKIPINTKTVVIAQKSDKQTKNSPKLAPKSSELRPLLLNGGGKDGSTSAFLLSKSGINFTWFQRGNSKAQSNVTKVWPNPAFVVMRHLDARRKQGKYFGHRPMSAGIAMLALFSAQAFGFTHVIASNESSANEGNMTIDGFTINHQYSKSLEFESDLKDLAENHNILIPYFSLLRPLHEIQIAKIFGELKNNQLRAITSCNNGTSTGVWCMSCAKCAFVALVLYAASPRAAEAIWGKDAINNPALSSHIRELVDPNIDKPLECVGTLDECQIALGLLSKNKEINLSNELSVLAEQFGNKDPRAIKQLMTNFENSLTPSEFSKVLELAKTYLDPTK